MPSTHTCTGFTAIVDKKLSAKYETLVNEASELIEVLPWGKDFEVCHAYPLFPAVAHRASGGRVPQTRLHGTAGLVVRNRRWVPTHRPRFDADPQTRSGIPAGINVRYFALSELGSDLTRA